MDLGFISTIILIGSTMTTFAHNVYEAFENLRSKYHFVPARAACGKRFASLIRQIDADVFAYVFVHDGRPGNSSLDVDFWLAPPDVPDHTLEALYVGYKIRIGSEYEIDDDFFASCENRIIHLLPCLKSLCPLIESELMNPSFRTRRWHAYQMERRLYSYFISKTIGGDPRAVALKKEIDLIAHTQSLGKIEKACLPIARDIYEERLIDEDILEFYEGQTTWLASALASQLYIRGLGVASVSQKNALTKNKTGV